MAISLDLHNFRWAFKKENPPLSTSGHFLTPPTTSLLGCLVLMQKKSFDTVWHFLTPPTTSLQGCLVLMHKKAFDAVWHPGLIYKMARDGILAQMIRLTGTGSQIDALLSTLGRPYVMRFFSIRRSPRFGHFTLSLELLVRRLFNNKP